MLDLPNTTIPSISVYGGKRDEQAQLTVDARYSKLCLEHRPAGAITHTIVVLNSSSSSILVHLFVNDRIVSSNLTLVSTAIAETLQRFNTVLLGGSVDFTEADESGAFTLLVMLMDTLQGLVYHGVLETRLHADTHHLSLYSQDWNLLFQFGSMVFYTTLSVPSHYSFAACQTRNSAVVAAEQLLLGTGNEDPLVNGQYSPVYFVQGPNRPKRYYPSGFCHMATNRKHYCHFAITLATHCALQNTRLGGGMGLQHSNAFAEHASGIQGLVSRGVGARTTHKRCSVGNCATRVQNVCPWDANKRCFVLPVRLPARIQAKTSRADKAGRRGLCRVLLGGVVCL